MAAGVGVARKSSAPAVSVRRDIKALTGLRAVAATLVVLLHFQRFLWPYIDQVPMLRAIVSSGWLGVDLFFVLSGFVLTLSYIEQIGHRPRPAAIGRFLVARVARVWPAWVVVTAVMIAFVATLRAIGWNADVLTPHPQVDVGTVARHLSMTQMWGEQGFFGVSYIMPGWSISAEWLAYLAFPLLAVLMYPMRRFPAPVLLACSALMMGLLTSNAFLYGPNDQVQNWYVRIAAGFTAGMFAALAVRKIERTERVESRATVASAVLVIWIIAVFLWSAWRRGGDLSLDYSGVAVVLFPLLVASLSLSDRGVSSFLGRPAMVYGGKISYCLYLVHFVVLDVVTTLLWQEESRAWQLTPGLELAVPVMVTACFFMAAGLHRWVEEPGRRAMMQVLDRATARRQAIPVRRRSSTAAAPAVAGVPSTLSWLVPRSEEASLAPGTSPATARLQAVGRHGVSIRAPQSIPAHPTLSRAEAADRFSSVSGGS